MPVFSREALEADQDELERLRSILHGPSGRGRLEADRKAPPAKARLASAGPDVAKTFGILDGHRRDPVR
jgi:hypothetical protein